MVVGQLVERLLTTPEVCGLNPVFANFILPIKFIEKNDNSDEKEAGNGPFLKNNETVWKEAALLVVSFFLTFFICFWVDTDLSIQQIPSASSTAYTFPTFN